MATLTPVHMDIFAANGSQINILGWMRIRFEIQCIIVFADLLMSEDIHEFMLWYDWLVAQGAHWYFDWKILCVLILFPKKTWKQQIYIYLYTFLEI